MPFDAHTNLAIATIQIAPTPASSGTVLGVADGEYTRFPPVPFNATIWPATQPATPLNAEVVRVTEISGVFFTIVRAQEATLARAIQVGDLIAATITAKVITDIENGTNFPLLTTPGSVTTGGHVLFSTVAKHAIAVASVDGADAGAVLVQAAGPTWDPTPARGACVAVHGNESPGAAGIVQLLAGDVAGGGQIYFQTGAGAIRGVVHRSGGLSWGGTVDPGAPGQVLIGAAEAGAGVNYTLLTPGGTHFGVAIGTAANVVFFSNANGFVGFIQTNGSTTAYLTTSDARLKTDRGVLRADASGAVLRETVVHEFTWTVDGTPGRGVFAQEAVAVAPFAVAVGTDEVDAGGRLVQPWAVDYAKYVPDLIVGWQMHEATVAALTAQVAALEARLAALEARLPPV